MIVIADLERIKRDVPITDLIAQSLTVTGRGETLTTAEHDSLKIFTQSNSFTWFSQTGKGGGPLGGSVIDWYAHVHDCPVGEAIRALGAMLEGGTLPVPPKVAFAPKAKTDKATWKDAQWQQRIGRELSAAQDTLWNLPSGKPGRDYLAGRGFSPDMAVAFGLGFADAWNDKAGCKLPALWIPWMNKQITAVQYRFVGVEKGDETKDRFLQPAGGKRLLFGLQHCMAAEPGQLDTLFLVEGELNAASIFQCIYGMYAADVVSFGPCKNIGDHNRELIIRVANRYRHVIVWADEPGDALRALDALPNALPVKSPGGKDANDLLRVGRLDDLIFRLIRKVKTPPDPDGERRVGVMQRG